MNDKKLFKRVYRLKNDAEYSVSSIINELSDEIERLEKELNDKQEEINELVSEVRSLSSREIQ